MHDEFEMAVPAVGVVPPCLHALGCAAVVPSGAVVTLERPVLTPRERNGSFPVYSVVVMQSLDVGLALPSGTQQPVLPVLAVLFQTSIRKYGVRSVPVYKNTRDSVKFAAARSFATDSASDKLCPSPFSRAFFCIRCQVGIAIAATIAITARTITSSISENPAVSRAVLPVFLLIPLRRLPGSNCAALSASTLPPPAIR